MKFDYKFHNLLGTVYRKGDIVFTHDGNSVISPVGNRISINNLKQNKGSTLPIESNFNYTALDISPDGTILIAVNERGQTQMISLMTCTVIHEYKFKKEVTALRFSPDGKYFAACCDNVVFVLSAPGKFTGEYRAISMKRVFAQAHDETTSLDWSCCSQILAVGSKDTSTRLYTIDNLENFKQLTIGGHSDPVLGVFFEKGSLDLITVGRNGQVCIWESSVDSDSLVLMVDSTRKRKRRKIKKEKEDKDDSEDDVDEKDAVEKVNEEAQGEDDAEMEEPDPVKGNKQLKYKRLSRHYIGDAARAQNFRAHITAVKYHKETKILVTGFSTGVFYLHEMPDVNLIHTLSISEHGINSIAISAPGDWIAFGCPKIGQLLVWEWQSEQYVMKQQGHSLNMTCLCYSPDGQYVVTGGYDGKVKVWNTTSGFCFVTFTEHSSTITAIQFSNNKKFFVTASLDGTVRCFDIIRYRNFRTLTSPTLVQFSCVALDASGELCAAGGQDVFDIFIWSIKFGKLLEVLGGHEAPVVCLSFSPVLTSSSLASASWDKTVKVWNCIDSTSEHETIHLTSDALQVLFRPDGEEIAVSTLAGEILFFSTKGCDQTSTIEGRNDLGSGRADTDLITAEKMVKSKAFTTICYSADGSFILGGGNSKHVCLYNINTSVLIKKFVITQNKSLDAVNDFINRRMLTEFGNMALVEERDSLEGGNQTVRLPGVRKGDMADRNVKPEVRVHCIRFSPTGESFAVAATEGLLIYSQNAGLDSTFRPYRLQLGATPQAVRVNLTEEKWGEALVAALQLNEHTLIQQVIETIPVAHIELTVVGLEEDYSDRLLASLAVLLEESRHLEALLRWVQPMLNRRRKFPPQVLLALEKVMTVKYSLISKMCEFNKYTTRCIRTVRQFACKKEECEQSEDEKEELDLANGLPMSSDDEE